MKTQAVLLLCCIIATEISSARSVGERWKLGHQFFRPAVASSEMISAYRLLSDSGFQKRQVGNDSSPSTMSSALSSTAPSTGEPSAPLTPLPPVTTSEQPPVSSTLPPVVNSTVSPTTAPILPPTVPPTAPHTAPPPVPSTTSTSAPTPVPHSVPTTMPHAGPSTAIPIASSTAPPDQITTINSGTVPVVATVVRGSCTISGTTPHIFILSPNYPQYHSRYSECLVKLNTTEPRILRLVPATPNISTEDYMRIYGVHRDSKIITSTMSGRNIYFPSTLAYFTYRSYKDPRSSPFYIYVESLNNACHQIIQLRSGASGSISLPGNFTTSPVCEWWLRALNGERIEMTVTEFDSGNSACDRSYALFNYAGNNFHNQDTYRLCGTTRAIVRSVGSQLNVLFDGRDSTNPKFTATYRLISSDEDGL